MNFIIYVKSLISIMFAFILFKKKRLKNLINLTTILKSHI